MSEHNDTRSSARKNFRCNALVLLNKAPSLQGRTMDLGSSGISVVIPEQLAPGQVCMIAFETLLQNRKFKLQQRAKVVYAICGSAGFRTGFQFIDLAPDNTRIIADLFALLL
ncbi:MAG: PilZ domain-containing protein [Pseudomonadota bacterium]